MHKIKVSLRIMIFYSKLISKRLAILRFTSSSMSYILGVYLLIMAGVTPGMKCERNVDRYQPPDWHIRNRKLVNEASTTRDESISLRKDAQLLKLETDTKTKWHNYENNLKLQRRYT